MDYPRPTEDQHSGDGAPPRRRATRPLADAAVQRLLDRSSQLAKGWLLELVQARPLERAPALLAAGLAASGPRICEIVVGAILSDEGLAELQVGGRPELALGDVAELVDARSPAEVSAAVESLRGVIWSALRREQPESDPEFVWALGERLSLALEAVLSAALQRFAAGESGASGAAASGAAASGAAAPPPAPDRLSARVAEEIAFAERDGTPLALLRIELEDAGRIAAVEGADWPGFQTWEDALRPRVRREDFVVPPADGGAWLLVRGERPAAHAVAARVAATAGELPPWRGAVLSVAVGVAVLGEDARTADELIAAADVSRFAASAAGLTVGPPAS